MKNFSNTNVVFKEIEFGKVFSCLYIDHPSVTGWDWAIKEGATHVYTSEAGHQRALIIGATVAYVFVDEDEYGKSVKQKWQIKHL